MTDSLHYLSKNYSSSSRIVTVRAVTELDFVSFRYSPDDRYDTRSNIQTTMYY